MSHPEHQGNRKEPIHFVRHVPVVVGELVGVSRARDCDVEESREQGGDVDLPEATNSQARRAEQDIDAHEILDESLNA